MRFKGPSLRSCSPGTQSSRPVKTPNGFERGGATCEGATCQVAVLVRSPFAAAVRSLRASARSAPTPHGLLVKLHCGRLCGTGSASLPSHLESPQPLPTRCVPSYRCVDRLIACRAMIELSPRVLDSPERMRLTLAHEMCHAAQWLVDGTSKPPHGTAFRSWARQVERRTDIVVTTRHTFDVHMRCRPHRPHALRPLAVRAPPF